MKAAAFLLFLPLFAQALPPEAKTPKISLSRLQATYRDAATLQADFTQEVYQATLARTKTSKGVIRLKKPNLFRWEVEEPEASLTVSDGKKLRYYTPLAGAKGKGQVIERPARDLTRQPLYQILSGATPLNEEFRLLKSELADDVTAGDRETRVTLRPKNESNWNEIEEVAITVNARYLISEVNILHATGNKTRIRLHNQALGSKLPSKLFRFSAPQGAEVIQN